ncbi:MAG: hypothetical protein BGO92_09870 [Magnetospirillum sp. 64-120]|nr:MAG: hypothetical protein BGO92_09870 [Magnetospirillum sp. 64-120]
MDIVGIPEPQLREHLEHVLAQDSAHVVEPQTLLGLAQHLTPDDRHTTLDHQDDTVEGHEDMLPQLRLVDALLGKNSGDAPQQTRRPFAELISAEQYRRQRRKRISRRTDSPDTLPPPSPQAENDRLLLEEIGHRPVHRAGGWTAEQQDSHAAPGETLSPPLAPQGFSTGDEVMDAFVPLPDAVPQEAPPPIALKVRRKEKPTPQSAVESVPESIAEPQPTPSAKSPVKLKIKGKPRRQSPQAETVPETPAAEAATALAPAPAPQPEPQQAAKPAVKMKVKGKPRRHAPQAETLPETPAAETATALAPAPEPQSEPQQAAKPAVKMKVKGKPRRQSPQAETAPEPLAEETARPSEPAPEPQPEPQQTAEAAPESLHAPEPSLPPEVEETVPAAEAVRVQVDDPLAQRIEDIIAAHARRDVVGAPPRGSFDLPENREALAKLLDDTAPAADFDALDLVYGCWGKTTHDSDSRALLAVAQQISRNFGLPDKLPMASTKAWKMLDNKLFAPELADRLEQVGQFIVDWQKTQRIFLILEFSEIELIEYLFEALSPADYPELLAEVMNFKVLSNRRMGLLRRFPARLRKQTQPMLPDRKEEALVVQAHGKAFLQRIADPRGFAPIVDLAGKMLEEVEKLMKQTANTGAPPQLGAPPGGGGGGGGALGRIG